MVTNSRKMFRAPITSRVCSPRNFRSCGTRPIEANGKISVPSPISVHPSITAEAPTLQSGPIRTCGPTTACGPMVVPSPDFGGRMDDRRRMDLGAIGNQPEQQLALGDDLIVDKRRRLREGERAAALAERNLEAEPVARHDLPPELGVVDAAQVDARPRGAASCATIRIVATWTNDSIISTAGISGVPGKWPWKNSSLTVTFLTRPGGARPRAR